MSSFLLPGQNIKGFLYLLVLNLGFISFSLNFFVMIKHPKLGINLFFNDTLFKFLFFIHQLLFSFYLSSSNHERCFFLSQVISFHLEFPLKSVLNSLFSFLFSLFLQLVKSCCHFGSYLLWRFKILHKFFFILLIFSCKNLSKLRTTLVKIGSSSFLHVQDSISNDVTSNFSVGLSLPFGFQSQVFISLDGIKHH
jgi:hypothetical protein